MQALYNKARGFTIVEIIVVIFVLGILADIVFVTLSDYYIGNSTSAAKTVQESDTRAVLRAMEEDISEATSFVPEYPIGTTPPAPLGSHDDTTPWNYMDNGRGPVLIIYKNAVTQLPTSDPTNSRTPVFEKPTNGCGDLSAATPAKNAYIYYVALDPFDNSKLNLYRRIITPPAADVCGTNALKTTCSPTKVTLNPSQCFGSDALLVRDITAFDVQYFDTANAESPYSDAYNSGKTAVERYPHITNAGAIEITVTSNTIKGQHDDTPTTATIRISLS